MSKVQFIVGEKDKGLAIFNEFVSASLIGMAQPNRYDRDSTDFKALRTCWFVVDVGSYVGILDRKVGWRHNSGKHSLNELLGKRASLHLDMCSFKVKRLKKGEAHEVIPMRMGKDDIIAEAPFFDHLVSEPSNSRTSINYNCAIIFGPDLNASGIAPVFDVFLPGNRNRTS